MPQNIDLYQPTLKVQYISGRQMTYEPQWRIDGYVLPFNKLYLITEGAMIVEMDEKTYHLRRGDMILIPRGKKHSMRHTEKRHVEEFHMHFTLELEGGFNFFDAPDLISASPVVSFIHDYEMIVNIFSQIRTPADITQRMAVLTHLNALCLTIVSYYIEKKISASGRSGKPFTDIIAYMQNNLTGLSLQDLANMAYLSPEHFIRKFKAAYGVSPMKYYDRIRIDFATAAIRDGLLSFTEIAEQIGITDLCYFSKFFKKHVGLSPTGYQKTCHSQRVMFMAGDNRPDRQISE